MANTPVAKWFSVVPMIPFTTTGILRSRIVGACTGAVLLGIGFVVPALWPLALVGVAPLTAVFARTDGSWRSTFGLGWLAGAIIYGFAVYGVSWSVMPLNWLAPHEPIAQVIFITFAWSAIYAGMAVATGVWALCVRACALRDWRDVFFIPSLWVLAEVVGAYMFQLVLYGKSTILGQPDFTLGFIGYQLAESVALVQLAWLGGVFVMSWIAAMCGVALYRVIVTRSSWEKRVIATLGVVGCLAWFVSSIAMHTPASVIAAATTITVAVLSTHLMGGEGDTQQLAFQQAVADQPASVDLVVLPEEAEYFAKLDAAGAPYPTGARTFLDSGIVDMEGEHRYQANYYDTHTGDMQHTYKRFLIPVGEYMPYVGMAIARVFNLHHTTSFTEMLAERQYAVGEAPSPITVGTGASIGFLFCNEAMSPSLYRSLTRQGAQLLVNAASHLWFHGSPIVFAQMQHAAKVRAVENGRWFVQSNNDAPAFVLDDRGRVVYETGRGMGDGTIRTSVPLLTTTTPYAVLGPWGILGFFAAIAGMFALPRRPFKTAHSVTN